MAASAGLWFFDFELRLDDAGGKLIGTGSILPPKEKLKPGAIGFGVANIQIEPVTDGKFHTIYIVSKPKDAKESTQIFLQSILFNYSQQSLVRNKQ